MPALSEPEKPPAATPGNHSYAPPASVSWVQVAVVKAPVPAGTFTQRPKSGGVPPPPPSSLCVSPAWTGALGALVPSASVLVTVIA